MAGRKRTIPGPDGPVEVEVAPFRSSVENWNEVFVEDGSVIKIKLVVSDVYRVIDKWDQEGQPQYIIRSTNIVRVDATDDLRKDPQ